MANGSDGELLWISMSDILGIVFTFSISTLPVLGRGEVALKGIPERLYDIYYSGCLLSSKKIL